MDKKKVLSYVGIAAIFGGAAALYYSGSTEANALNIVSGAFVILGIIASFLKGKAKE